MNFDSYPLTPEIYVICLAAHRAGHEYGFWIDATQDPDEMLDEIKAMLTKSPVSNSEEWEIQDIQDFGDVEISKAEDLDLVQEKALFVEKYGEVGAAVLANHGKVEYAQEIVDNCYYDKFRTKEEFSVHELEKRYDGDPAYEALRAYIDIDMYCSDLLMTKYEEYTVNGYCYIFLQN
jgi:antirestriction protein